MKWKALHIWLRFSLCKRYKTREIKQGSFRKRALGRELKEESSSESSSKSLKESSRERAQKKEHKRKSSTVSLREGTKESKCFEGIHLEQEESEPCPVGAC